MRRLVAVALGLFVALGAVVLAERWQRAHELGSMQVWFDPPGLKYVLAPGTDELDRGWREGEPVLPKRPGVPRVVCLGDSVTFGVNVGNHDTWCTGLRRGLGKAEALNFGMNGWDAEQVATLLESRVAAWEPDVVVWGTYVNDVFPTYLLYGQVTGDPVFVGSDVPERARVLPESLSLFLVRHSALFRRFQGAAYARSERAQGPGTRREGWYEAQVDRVAAWSRDTGVPVVFLAIPPHVMSDMRTCPAQFPVPALCEASAAQYRAITTALSERGLNWVDGLAAFQASGQPHYHPEGRLDPDHPNAAGHAVLARAVLPAVQAALGRPADAVTEPAPLEAAPGRGMPRHPGGGKRGARREGQ